MTTPTVILASYDDAHSIAVRFHNSVFDEPTAISSSQLFAGLDSDKTKTLAAGLNTRRYGYILHLGDEVIGWHLARQQSPSLYSMESSGIRPEFQGRGYYKLLLDAAVQQAREEGFAAIVSTHAANNNRILIPKLRYGFYIKGFEINPMYGLDVKLIYYFNEGQKKAHDLRCGSRATFD